MQPTTDMPEYMGLYYSLKPVANEDVRLRLEVQNGQAGTTQPPNKALKNLAEAEPWAIMFDDVVLHFYFDIAISLLNGISLFTFGSRHEKVQFYVGIYTDSQYI